MKTLTVLVVCCVLFATSEISFSQTASPAAQAPTSPTIAFGLLEGTPIKLRLSRTISSADAKIGETIDFEVLEDVKAGDSIVIARGGTALGTVTNAKPKGRMGKGGKLDINIDSVRLVNGEKVALRAVKETKGGSHTGAMTGAIVATSILFFPAAPFFLFMKGKDITIPKGTEISAYVNGDSSLNPKQFTSGSASTTNSVSNEQLQPVNFDSISTISVKSTPDGADIEVDGKFMGSTPSSLKVSSGEHKVTIKKNGFAVWERKISLSAGGNIVIDASLEKNP